MCRFIIFFSLVAFFLQTSRVFSRDDTEWSFIQDTLYTAANQRGRDLRQCDQAEKDSILCQDAFVLSTGEDCTVTATCPLKSNLTMTDCSCRVEIDGVQCKECMYCDENGVSINCKGVYNYSGCHGIDCNGECINNTTFTWKSKIVRIPKFLDTSFTTEDKAKDSVSDKVTSDQDRNGVTSIDPQAEDNNNGTSTSYPNEDRDRVKSNASVAFSTTAISTLVVSLFAHLISL